MTVPVTTSISLHVKEKKSSEFTTRDEKLNFRNPQKSRFLINIYMAKLRFILLRLLKKENRCEKAVNGFFFYTMINSLLLWLSFDKQLLAERKREDELSGINYLRFSFI